MDFGKCLTEKFQQNPSFASVGVPLFIQRLPQYRDSDTTPDDGQHQDVDTGFAVFPCCAVVGEADVLPGQPKIGKTKRATSILPIKFPAKKRCIRR